MKRVLVSIIFLLIGFIGGLAVHATWTGEADEDSSLPRGKVKSLRHIPVDLIDANNKPIPSNSHMEILCVDGYKYVFLGRHPVSGITQIFRWDESLKQTVPVRCLDFSPMEIHQDQTEAKPAQ